MQTLWHTKPTDDVVYDIVQHVKNELICTAYALRERDKGTGINGKPIVSLRVV